MSEDFSTLLSVAQIAGIFVGFAALVSAFGGRDTQEDRPQQLANLRGAVVVGVIVLVAALFPVGLGRYGLSEELTWRLSSAAFLALIHLSILGIVRTENGYRQAFRSYFRANPVASVLFWLILEPAIQVPLVLSVLGVAPRLAPAFYLTALLINLCQAALGFSLLVFSEAFFRRS